MTKASVVLKKVIKQYPYSQLLKKSVKDSLREKCPNTKFFLVRIFLYSVRIQENTDQEKLHIWTIFTQLLSHNIMNEYVPDNKLYW